MASRRSRTHPELAGAGPEGQHAPAMAYPLGQHPQLPPPAAQSGPIAWVRDNLFGSPLDIFMTACVAWLLYTLLPPLIDWAFVKGTWFGKGREDCNPDGACWVFINVRFNQFVYGFYPQEDHWRVNLTGAILAVLGILFFVPRIPYKGAIALISLTVFPVIAYVLLVGGVFGLEHVETPKWGGVFLTVLVSVVGIVMALGLGIVLALGRQSSLPVISALCTGYIEFVRAVPFITILFMASVMLPLFLPEGVSLEKLLRAMIGTGLFWAAYMAESVRGGLQALPRGQYEAASAIGLNYWKSMGLIILPQALKHSIPGIMNTIISLVKDTTLLLLIGIFELLGIVQAAAADPKWLGNYVEGYVFVALVFFAFCFGMSLYSQRLEKRLDTGH